jgi:hypothetical protein
MNTQNKYIDFEVSPCCLVDSMGEAHKLSEYTLDTPWHLDACDNNDPNIVCWSVFGVINGLGRECIADYLDKQFALWMSDRLREGLDLIDQLEA